MSFKKQRIAGYFHGVPIFIIFMAHQQISTCENSTNKFMSAPYNA